MIASGSFERYQPVSTSVVISTSTGPCARSALSASPSGLAIDTAETVGRRSSWSALGVPQMVVAIMLCTTAPWFAKISARTPALLASRTVIGVQSPSTSSTSPAAFEKSLSGT